MKQIMIQLTAVILVTLSMAGMTMAQTSMSLKVPFDFYAGETLLPAGEYKIVRVFPGSHAFRIMGLPNSAVTINTMPVRTVRESTKQRLVFNRYEKENFLSQIWWPGSDTGAEIVKSKFEVQLAKNKSANPRTTGNR